MLQQKVFTSVPIIIILFLLLISSISSTSPKNQLKLKQILQPHTFIDDLTSIKDVIFIRQAKDDDSGQQENLLTQNNFLAMQKKLGHNQELIYKNECNIQWSYNFNGHDWNCLCSTGRKQSPIDICDSSIQITAQDQYYFILTSKLQFDNYYADDTGYKITNTGKTIKIEYKFGQVNTKDTNDRVGQFGAIELGYPGDIYDGYSIHFHVPSEHTFDNRQLDMEMHLVLKKQNQILNSDPSISKQNYQVYDDQIEPDQHPDSFLTQQSLHQINGQNYLQKYNYNQNQNQYQYQKQKQNNDYLVVVVPFKAEEKKSESTQNADEFFENLNYSSFPQTFLEQISLNNHIDFDKLFRQTQIGIEGLIDMNRDSTLSKQQIQNDFSSRLKKITGPNNDQSSFKSYLKRQSELYGYSEKERLVEQNLFYLTEKDIETMVEQLSCKTLYESSEDPKKFNHGFTDCKIYSFLFLFLLICMILTEYWLANLLTIINYLNYDPYHPLKDYYFYSGSQSSPPCTENVEYIIKKEPIKVDLEIVKSIAQKIEKGGSVGGNNRQTQDVNHRKVHLLLFDILYMLCICEQVQLYQKDNLWNQLGFIKDMKCWKYPQILKQVIYYYVPGKQKMFNHSEIVDLDKISPIVRDTLILFLKDKVG